jgi:hypothetical protein
MRAVNGESQNFWGAYGKEFMEGAGIRTLPRFFPLCLFFKEMGKYE